MTFEVEEITSYAAFCNECGWEGNPHEDYLGGAEAEGEKHDLECPEQHGNEGKPKLSERDAWQLKLDIAAGLVEEEEPYVGYSF